MTLLPLIHFQFKIESESTEWKTVECGILGLTVDLGILLSYFWDFVCTKVTKICIRFAVINMD